MTLGGNVCIRNGARLDYPWAVAVQSLLPICDKVVISDCSSDDGTREAIAQLASTEPKIITHDYPWTDPKGDPNWWPIWMNTARQHLPTDWHIQLDADEILHQDDLPLIQESVRQQRISFFRRLNFWKDSRHLIPEGHCCGTKVLRLAPTNMPIPSDYPYEPANATMAQAVDSNIRVFHYSFLRSRDAFFRKAREVLRIWAGSYDERLERAEKFDGPWAEMPGVTGWESSLVEYTGDHPEVIKPWLRERGYEC